MAPKYNYKEYLQGHRSDPWNVLSIDLDAIASNYRYLDTNVPDESTLYAVLKSDAYGHGIKEVGTCLADQGCRHFAVETPQEGVLLRHACIQGEILIMNPIPDWMTELVVSYDLSPSVIHPSILEPLNKAAVDHGHICKVHLNLNVGLHRMGIAPSKITQVVHQLADCSHLEFTGLYGQPRDPDSIPVAFDMLISVRDKLIKDGLEPQQVHFANSITYLTHPETAELGLRIGILLYGILPPEQAKKIDDYEQFKPAMKLTSKIVQIRHLNKGSLIGYRTRTRTKRDSVIATIPIGYAHGLDRRMAKEGLVLIQGRPAPYIGPISMNAATVDVTDIPDPQIGMPVIVVGKADRFMLNLNRQARQAGTIAADLMTRFGTGVDRDFKYRMNQQSISTKIELKDKIIACIYTVRNEEELPHQLTVQDIIDFLLKNMIPYGDDQDTYHSAISHALALHQSGGFLIITQLGSELTGVLVCVRTNTSGFIPENIAVYICSHKEYREKGIAKKMVELALETCKGPMKLHADFENPAIRLYENLGFTQNYIEMRHPNGG